MRKIFLLISILFTLYRYENVGAACNNCKIQHAPAPALTQYIGDLYKIIAEANSQAAKSKPNISAVDARLNKLAAGYRSVLTIDSRLLEGDYNFFSQLSSTTPPQIHRDYELLMRTHKDLLNTLSTYTKSGYSSATIKNICNSRPNCRFPEKIEYMALMLQLIENHEKLTRSFLLGVRTQSIDYDIQLVDNNFSREMSEHYGIDAVSSCSQCDIGEKKSSWSEIKEKFQNIGDNMAGSHSARQRWKRAWDLLKGINTPQEEVIEQSILNSYLMNNGLNRQQADKILENLTNFNRDGFYSTSNNPLANTASYTYTNAKKEVDTFKAVFYNRENQDSVQPIELKYDEENLKNSEYIAANVNNIFLTGQMLGANQDVNTSEIIQRLTQIHIVLTHSIKQLEKKEKDAIKVCNDQSPGQGICKYH